MDQNDKELHELLFFCISQYEFTYNKEIIVRNTQVFTIFEIPYQDDLKRFNTVKVFAPGINSVEFYAIPQNGIYYTKVYLRLKWLQYNNV